MKNRHIRYTLDRKSFFGKAAMLCLFLSIVFRGIGAFLNPTIFRDQFDTVEFALPILCALLYLLSVLFFGRRWFKITIVPFLLGVMACVLRLFSFDNIMQQEMSVQRILVSVCFYLVLTAVYSAVVFSGLRAKYLLFVLFLVPLAYHIGFEIVPAFRGGYPINAYLVLMELSVLAVIFAMLFVSLGLSSKTRLKEVDPESGKVVSPPVPGDSLDVKPPIPSQASPAEPEPKEEAPQPPAEAPAEKGEEESKEELLPSVKPEAPQAEVTPVAEKAENLPKPSLWEEKEYEYDPFAPSEGPIKLTLNPILDDSSKEGEDA